MANWNDDQATRPGFGMAPSQSGSLAGTTFDAGLRQHMLAIYNYMTSGVLLTGIVAMLFARSGMAAQVMTGGLMTWLIILSPLAIVFAMSFGAARFSKGTLQAMYWGFAVLMGLSLSTIFLVYTASSIAVTFFATAAAFAGLSLFGYTTKKDLTGFGSFLIMGVIGLIIASVVNIFLQSGTMQLIISALGGLILRWRLKWIIAAGLGFGVIRFLFSALDTRTGLIVGIVLHGCSFTLVNITAQIYLDQRVEPSWRGRAQALLSLMNGGFGNLLGYLGTGAWFAACTAGGRTQWSAFWLGLAVSVAGVLAVFLVAYRGRSSGLTPPPFARSG